MIGGYPPSHEVPASGLRALADRAGELLMMIGDDRRLSFANTAFERVLGYRPADLLGRDVFELIAPDDIPGLAAAIAELTGRSDGEASADFRMQSADGAWHAMTSHATNRLTDPDIGCFVVCLREIAGVPAASPRAVDNAYRRLLEQAAVGIFSADFDGRMRSGNESLCDLLGYSIQELVQMSIFDLVDPNRADEAQAFSEAFDTGVSSHPSPARLIDARGVGVDVEIIWWLVDGDGDGHYEGIVREIARRNTRRRSRAVERFRALHDPLTGLPNRALLDDRIAHAFARRKRNGGGVAVLLVGLDDFKLVNDALGHETGDAVLCELSTRLKAILRPEETLARLGGDEFCLIVERVIGYPDALELAGRIKAVLAEPFALRGTDWLQGGSIGIALANGEPFASTDLLRDADTALNRAKATGKGKIELFDAALRTQLLRRLEVSRALEKALDEESLEIVYQPIVSLSDGTVFAVEALVRWRHPQWGMVEPEEFISLAEDNRLILRLGRFMLRRAAAQIAIWRVDLPGLLPNGIGVNISARELAETDFVAHLAAVRCRHGLDVRDLALELTERVVVDHRHPTVRANLAALASDGVRLVLDDFGTGYSALASLNRFPLLALKIDRYFTSEIKSPSDDSPVIRAVISLGRELGLTVTAEGIETRVQLDYLRALGCERGQGFLLGRPETAAATTAMLHQGPNPL